MFDRLFYVLNLFIQVSMGFVPIVPDTAVHS